MGCRNNVDRRRGDFAMPSIYIEFQDVRQGARDTRGRRASLDDIMTDTQAVGVTGTAARAAALLSSFMQAGYIKAEPVILQPAEPFLDLSGEEIRKSQ